MKIEILNRLLRDRSAKTPVALATNLASGEQALVYDTGAEGDLAGNAAVCAAAREAMREDKSGTTALPDGDVFIHVFNPALRFIIVGAVLQISSPEAWIMWVAGITVLMTSINIAGGFAVTHRMLQMFRK